MCKIIINNEYNNYHNNQLYELNETIKKLRPNDLSNEPIECEYKLLLNTIKKIKPNISVDIKEDIKILLFTLQFDIISSIHRKYKNYSNIEKTNNDIFQKLKNSILKLLEKTL